MTRIVASLVERSVSGASCSSRQAFRQGADLVELRLDHIWPGKLGEEDVREARKAVRGPAVATLRSREEGGRSTLKGSAREKTLRTVLAAGFEFVDLEVNRDRALLDEFGHSRRGPRVIASVHLPAPAGPGEVEDALGASCQAGHVGKVAMPCGDASDAIILAELGLRRSAAGDQFVLIGMGEQGLLTRVCADRIGSAMIYCGLRGKPAAPGQLDVHTQSSFLRGETTVLGLLGHPLEHSVSKPMQEAALRKAGLTGAYMNLDLSPAKLTRGALETLAKLGFSGLNVTIPHKETVLQLCDTLDPEAESCGAVNTVGFKGTTMHGKNTDVIGFTEALKSKKDITRDTHALLFGAGGAARAAAFGLGRMGAHVTLFARDQRKAARLAEELSLDSATADSLRRGDRRFQIIVNCTPLGTKGVGGIVPVPPVLFGRGVLYFDMVYNPPMTRTMKAAMARNARAASGLDMLVRQGAASFKYWTGIEPDVRAMRSAARRALE